MKRWSVLVLVAVIPFVSMGCTQRLGDFTLMSTRNVDIGGQYVESGVCEGEDLKLIILIFPTGVPNMEDAADRCMRSANSDLMTNVVVRSKVVYFVVGAQTGYIIEGEGWRKATSSDLLDPNKKIYELASSENGLVLEPVGGSGETVTVYDQQDPHTYSLMME